MSRYGKPDRYVPFLSIVLPGSSVFPGSSVLPRSIVLSVFMVLSMAMVLFSCDRKKEESAETNVQVEIDSTYYTLNPMDLEFDSLEMVMIDSGMADYIDAYRKIRAYDLPNTTPPAFEFNPIPRGFLIPGPTEKNLWDIPEGISRPPREADLAFMSIPELASLIRSGEISCLALTEFFLQRLKEYDPQLHCVITPTEEYAIEQAKKLDAELADGHDRGILHGIPYGAKDLFAFPGYPTTWGAGTYRDQVLNEKAGVIRKLEDAGAVLVTKTTMGALAMGDVWFADTTRNPWNPEEGSSGSSAGSASATAAGLLPASNAMDAYKEAFGDDFYAEIMFHRYPGNPGIEEDEKRVMGELFAMARKKDVPCFCSNDVRYCTQDQAAAHDALLCLQPLRCIKDQERFSMNSDDFYLKSETEMNSAFSKHPELLKTTLEIAEKVEGDVMESGGDYVPGEDISGDVPPDQYLRELVVAGMQAKGLYDIPEYRERMEHELKVFSACGYVRYFLVLWDFINNARSKDIRIGAGRGSAAGSLCLYALGVTALDPLKYDLLFERFLSVETVKKITADDFGLEVLA
ncbi:MAG: amidase family protein [Bacteroidales bacterium]